MAREIQWDDRRVERDSSSADILSGSAATWTALSPRSWAVLHEGQRFKVECEKEPDEEGRATFRINGVRKEVRVLDERAQLLEKMGMSARTVVASGDIKAPMPGKVLQVLVNAGDTVEEGQALLVLEAMKMENVIKAIAEGTVLDIPVSPGQAVEKGSLLVAFEA